MPQDIPPETMAPLNDFSWLEHEIRSIGTRKFFRLSDPPSAESLAEFESGGTRLPEDYRRFLLSFGGVDLFRERSRNDYKLSVFKMPTLAHVEGDLKFVWIGMRDGKSIYLLAQTTEPLDLSVLEHRASGGIVTANASFSEWLQSSFYREKNRYSKREWSEIVEGPVPFSDRELQIVLARRKWIVTKAGHDSKNNLLLQISNQSDETFRYITVYICSEGLRAHTPVRVDSLRPGETGTFAINFYKDLVRAEHAEILPLMDIGPEDRLIVYELTGPEWFRKRLVEGRPMGSELV